jgi:hypothetical protein
MVGGNFYRDKNWQPPFVFKSSIILAQAWSVERILIAVQDLIGLANGVHNWRARTSSLDINLPPCFRHGRQQLLHRLDVARFLGVVQPSGCLCEIAVRAEELHLDDVPILVAMWLAEGG